MIDEIREMIFLYHFEITMQRHIFIGQRTGGRNRDNGRERNRISNRGDCLHNLDYA